MTFFFNLQEKKSGEFAKEKSEATKVYTLHLQTQTLLILDFAPYLFLLFFLSWCTLYRVVMVVFY